MKTAKNASAEERATRWKRSSDVERAAADSLRKQLMKAVARIVDLERRLKGRCGNTAGPAITVFYERALRLTGSNRRRVLAVKITDLAREWLSAQSAKADGTHGGASGVAARILERAADAQFVKGGRS